MGIWELLAAISVEPFTEGPTSLALYQSGVGAANVGIRPADPWSWSDLRVQGAQCARLAVHPGALDRRVSAPHGDAVQEARRGRP